MERFAGEVTKRVFLVGGGGGRVLSLKVVRRPSM